jgi:hypothetical protein
MPVLKARTILGFMVFAGVLLTVASLSAQQSGGKLEGTVRDSQGLVVPAALVVATNQATNVAQESYANEAGLYIFPSLPPGKYTVSAEISGFRKFEVTDFVLEVATTKTLNFTLSVGQISEVVTVKSDAVQQVQTSTSDLGDVVFERKIKDLPLNGRLPIELIFLQAGMAGNNRQSSTGGLSANGSRVHSNSLSMDGVDITNSELGTGSTSGIQIATDITPSVDVIEEFRLITGNPGAEFGRVSGFQVEIATKSGTNQFHGSLYEFYRGTVLNANRFFNNASATPIRRPPLLRNQFGGTIGGPVRLPWLYNGKDRTFFFFNYEGMRQSESVAVNRTVLTQAARNGIYRFITSGVTRNPDTGATLTANSRVVVDPVTGQIRPGVEGIQTLDMIDAEKRFFDGIGADSTGLSKKFIDATPLPNDYALTGDGLNTAGFRWNAPAITQQDLYTFKIDHVLNPNHTLSLRGSYGRLDRDGDTINSVFAPFPDGTARVRWEDQSGFGFNFTSRLKPTLTNEFRIGLSRNLRLFSYTIEQPGTLAVTPGNPGAILFTNPFIIDELQKTPRQTFSIEDSLSWVKGGHAFKAGFEFRSTPLNQVTADNRITLNFSSSQTGTGGAQVNLPQLFGNPTGPNPIPTANSAAAGDLFNLLTGRIGANEAFFNAISEDAFGPLGTGKTRGFRQRDWGGFFQDDWKIRKSLTLNLGIRYDWFQVPWEVNSFYVLSKNRYLLDTQLSPGLPHVPLDFARVGPEFGNQIFANDLNNFGPVVGFSWDPWGSNKTAIRGSYRVSYDKIYSRTLDTIETRSPGMNGAGQLNAGQLAALFPLTNAFGMPRTARLADLVSSPTQAGVSVGSGSINLSDALDITKTQKPLAAVPNTRIDFSPSDYEKSLVSPYSQSWSFGLQREIMRNTIIEVRYVGRKGAKEFGGLPANQFRAPADILSGLQTVRGLLALTNAEAFAKAGLPLPSGLNPNAQITISQLYGTTPVNATSLSQYMPGALAGLAPQSLYNLFLAGNSTFDSDVETRIRNNNLANIIAQFDTSTNFHSNAFLSSAGMNPMPAGADPRGWLPLAVGLPDNAFRPNIQFLNGPRVASNGFYSSYHGFQTQINRRFYNGLQAQANYTFAKNLDITSTTQPTGQSVIDYFDRNADKGPSANDVTHDFKANFIYELPFGPRKRFGSSNGGVLGQVIGGWQVSSIIEVASSFPLADGIRYDSQSSSWGGGTRPDFVPGKEIDGSVNSIGSVRRDAQGRVIYFTEDDFQGLFQRPQLGTIGTVPRNLLRGPGYWDVTVGVLKNFRIAEGKEIQFRGEFFNIFNHVNFGDPNANLESGSFGQITTQRGDPRIIQLALKFYF